MAVEQSRVNDRYKAKFGSIALSKTRLDAMTAKLAGKIKDDATDEEIDGELNDLNEVYPFTEIKKNDDRLANEKNNPNKKPIVKEDEPKVDDDTPKWAKDLLAEVTALKTERVKETISQKFSNDPRVKDIPAFMRKGYVPTSEEDFEENVEALLAEYTPFAEKHKLEVFTGADAVNASTDNSQSKGKVTPISAEEAKAIVS